MSDLVERLRESAQHWINEIHTRKEAADVIERFTADYDRLLKAEFDTATALAEATKDRNVFFADLVDTNSRLAEAQAVVAAQAEDDGLWFEARTAPEAYLQQELRRLHAAVEGK